MGKNALPIFPLIIMVIETTATGPKESAFKNHMGEIWRMSCYGMQFYLWGLNFIQLAPSFLFALPKIENISRALDISGSFEETRKLQVSKSSYWGYRVKQFSRGHYYPFDC